MGSAPATPRRPRRDGRVVLTLCAVQFVDVMGVTVVVTALPQMVSDLHGGQAGGTAVVTAYAMAFGGLLMLASRIGDRRGHRRVLLWSILAFSVASLVAAFAGSIVVLAAARAIQGGAAAASVPAALRLLTSVIPPGRPRQRAVAAWSAAGAAAGALGFVVGGSLTEWASWRLVFLVMLLLGVGLLGATAAFVPSPPSAEEPPVIPWAPGLTLASSVAAIVVGATLVGDEGHRGAGVLLLVLAAAGAVAFRRVQRRSPTQLLPAAACRSPNVRWGAIASGANTATTSSSITVATLYLQSELELSPITAAGVLLPISLVVVLASGLAPRLIRARGWAAGTSSGLVVIGVGNLTMASVPSALGIAVSAGVCGAGLGVASVAANDMGTSVTTSAKSAAAALLNTTAQSGTAIGTAVALLLSGLIGPRGTWVVLALLGVGVAAASFASGPSGEGARETGTP